MAMVVKNNISAQLILGQLNKNQSKLSKSLEKVSSGEKIKGAKDDASGYAISEQMRVRIRALEQANQNVQNGGTLLKTAEEGIQQQIDLVRTIKEKVIDAANDTNTDQDRMIIQKEINQFYDQFEQTAFYSEYNTKKVLLGNTFWKTTHRWVKSPDDAVINPSSIMNIIPDKYSTLDNVEGPFDIFTEWKLDTNATIDPLLGSDSRVNLSGGSDDGTASVTVPVILLLH